MRNTLLFVHIVAVVVAFGPTYTFPTIAALARKNPKHAPFAAQVTEVISHRYTLPFVLIAGAAGVGLIMVGDYDLFATRWLLSSIVLYIAAIAFSLLYQQPNTRKMVELTARLAEAGPPPEGAPPGPPPELVALGKKLQMGGMILGIASIIMFLLMVFKPAV